MKISGSNVADAHDRDFRSADGVAKSNAGQDGNLVARIKAVDVQAGIRLSVAGRLRLFQSMRKLNAMLFHLRKNVVARAVHNSVNGLDAVCGERLRDRTDYRHSSCDRGFNSDRKISLLGQREQFVA